MINNCSTEVRIKLSSNRPTFMVGRASQEHVLKKSSQDGQARVKAWIFRRFLKGYFYPNVNFLNIQFPNVKKNPSILLKKCSIFKKYLNIFAYFKYNPLRGLKIKDNMSFLITLGSTNWRNTYLYVDVNSSLY